MQPKAFEKTTSAQHRSVACLAACYVLLLTLFIARRLENAMASPSPTVLATFDIAYAGFSVFQEELSSFASRSESVMSILNELSKIHRFISGTFFCGKWLLFLGMYAYIFISCCCRT